MDESFIKVNLGTRVKEAGEKTEDSRKKDGFKVMRDARAAEKEGRTEEAGRLYERVLWSLSAIITDEMRVECIEAVLRTGRRNPAWVLEYISDNRSVLDSSIRKIYSVTYSYLDADIRKAKREGRADDRMADLEWCVRVLMDQLRNTLRVPFAQEQIRNLFRARYEGYPRLRECVLRYFVDERNLLSKVKDFRKDIALVPGAFVADSRRRGKIGRIMDMVGTVFTVNFGASERKASISLRDAIANLTVLVKKDFRVIRKAVPSEKICSRIMRDPMWLAETLVRTATAADRKMPRCTMDDMKELVVPSLISENVWRNISRSIDSCADESEWITVLRGPSGAIYSYNTYPKSRDDKASSDFQTAGYTDGAVKYAISFLIRKDWKELPETAWRIKEYFLKRYTFENLSEKLTAAVILDYMAADCSLKAEHDRKTELFYDSLNSRERAEAYQGIGNRRIAQLALAMLVKHDPDAKETLFAEKQ